MTSRPEGPKKYDGPVILPGADARAVPVDPTDPTKGYVTPVATAAELTRGVTDAFAALNFLNQQASLLGNAMQDGFADIGNLLESLIHDIATEVSDGDTSWLSPSVQEFLTAREAARKEADEAAAAEAAALKQAALEEQDAVIENGG
jgi:hypothetical protein